MEDFINTIINKYTRREDLLPLLYELNNSIKEINYDIVKLISKRLQISTNDIYSVASFYPVFKLSGDKNNTIYVCSCNNCHINGSQDIYDYLVMNKEVNKINILKKVINHRILAAPVLVINNKIYEQSSISQTKSILANFK